MLVPGWDVLLLQEGFCRLEGINTGAHVLYTPPSRFGALKCPAIIVHRRWLDDVRAAGGGARWVAIAFRSEIMMISAHLPHSGRGLLELELAIEEISSFMAKHAGFKFFIGTDANAKLWGATDHYHVGAQVPRAVMSALDRERAKSFHTFIADWNLIAANTWMNATSDADLITRNNWDGSGSAQIDFVLVSEDVVVEDVWIEDQEWFATDHKPIVCRWRLKEDKAQSRSSRIICIRNWAPTPGWLPDAETMKDWNDWVHTADLIRDKAAKHRQRKPKRAEDEHLVDLLAQRKLALADAPARNRLNTVIWRRRRHLKRTVALTDLASCAASGKAPRPMQSKHVNWHAIVGPLDPGAALTAFYTDIFGLSQVERQLTRDQREQYISFARDLNIDNGRPFVTRASLDFALAKMKKGKGSHDGITAEMLQALPDGCKDDLARNLALRCAKLDIPPAWCAAQISLVPKVIGAKSLANFRPIAGLVAMRKLLGYLWMSSLPRLTFGSIQTAFVPGTHADTGPFMLNRAAELSREWRIPLAIAQIDIRKAFDHVDHRAAFAAMRRQRCSPYTIALIAAIWNASVVTVRLGQVSSSPIKMDRGLPQGAPESALIFTLIIDMIICSLADKWRQLGLGFEVDAFRITAVCYADDIILAAHTAEHLEQMVADVVEKLKEIGLGIGAEKSHWSSTPAQDGTLLNIEGTQISWESSLTFVGTVIDLSGNAGPAILYRMAQADKAYAKWKSVLTNSLVSRKARLSLLPATIWSSLLWSASTWNTTKAQRNQLASWSARLVAKVAKVRRHPDADGATHWRLVHRTGHALILQHKLAVVPRALQRVYRWAGHLARLPPEAPAASALRCRSMQWWRWRQHALLSASQVPGARGAHPRRFRILRWEEQLTAAHGEGFAENPLANTGWLLKAQNRDVWRTATAA
jgi:hypothetical protein